MTRIACAYLHHFPLVVSASSLASTEPVSLVDLAARQTRLQMVNELAERHGVKTGMKVSHALAQCPSLRLIAPDPEAIRLAESRILKALSTLSPLLDADGLGAFFLSADRLENIHPTEQLFAERVQQLLQSLGYTARIAIADRPLAAWVTARQCDSISLITAGHDARAIAGVEILELGLPTVVLERLQLLGIRHVGQMAALPPGMLATRIPDGARLERFCRGDAWIAWLGRRQPEADAEELTLELDSPVEGLEPILFTVKSLLDRLLARLAPTRRSLSELLIDVKLDDRTRTQHHLAPASPTLDSRVIIDLVRLWLSSGPFPSAVSEIRLVASRTDVATPRQVSLFNQQQEQSTDALQRATMRLRAMFGEHAVVKPILVDTHRPEERLRWVPFTPNDAKPTAPIELDDHAPLSLRLLPRPELVKQWTDRALILADGTSVRIIASDGPHRLAGDWWSEAYDRSYFWLMGSRGERLWIFREERSSAIFLQAVAD
jgi:protein ImuB